MDARLAAAAGAFAHGRAAALAPHQVGLVASDVIDSLPLALALDAPLRAHDRSRRRCGATCARCCARSTARELWAVVKADGYGHGAVDVAGAALGAGATALCVATIPEGLALRNEFRTERILVMGPAGSNREVAQARDAGLELAIADGEIPGGRARPPEARHRHGPLRALGAAAAARGGRRADDPSRDRRQRRRVRARAARALQRRDGASTAT